MCVAMKPSPCKVKVPPTPARMGAAAWRDRDINPRGDAEWNAVGLRGRIVSSRAELINTGRWRICRQRANARGEVECDVRIGLVILFVRQSFVSLPVVGDVKRRIAGNDQEHAVRRLRRG